MTESASVGATIEVAGTGLLLRSDAKSPPLRFDLSDVVPLTAAEQGVAELVPIRTDVGVGAVLASVLLQLSRYDGADCSPSDRRRVALVVRGLVSAVAAERVEDESFAVAPRQQVVVRAMQVIQSRRNDPRLTSQSIAGRIGVSVRTLHAAFSESSTTVARSVRAIRSEYEVLAAAEYPLAM